MGGLGGGSLDREGRGQVGAAQAMPSQRPDAQVSA